MRAKLLSRSALLHPQHGDGGTCYVASPLPHFTKAGFSLDPAHPPTQPAEPFLTVAGRRDSGRSSLALLALQDATLAAEAQTVPGPYATLCPHADEAAPPPDTIFVDYAAPNLGKDLHIGHGRSAIVGDALANLLAYSSGGHSTVHRCSHTGDFGAPLGKLLALGRAQPSRDLTDSSAYADAAALAAAEPAVAALARRLVASVVQADATGSLDQAAQTDLDNLATILRTSRATVQALLFRRLGLSPALREVSESWYVREGHVPAALADLQAAGATVEEEDGVLLTAGPAGSQRLVLRNSAGSLLYGATDAGALRYRLDPAHGTVDAVYVTDRGQASHFGLLFDLARSVGWADPARHSLRHVGLGLVLGADGKKLGSRKGGPSNLLLATVLDDAVAAATAARRALREVNSAENLAEAQLSADEAAAATETDEVVGLAAVKYYDLRHDHGADYAFDPVRATSLRGDTVVYLLYARVRALSLLERAGKFERSVDVPSPHDEMALADEVDVTRTLAAALLNVHELRPTQRELLLHSLLLDDVIAEATTSLRPQLLTTHLYALAGKLHSLFVDSGRMLGAPDEAASLAVVSRAALDLGRGLSLLGIPPLRRL